MSGIFTSPGTVSLAKAAVSPSSGFTTSGTPRTPWMPWMGACWTAGSCGCRWRGMDAPRRHIEGTAADGGLVPGRDRGRGTRGHDRGRGAEGVSPDPGIDQGVGHDPGRIVRVRGGGPGRRASQKERGPNQNPNLSPIASRGRGRGLRWQSCSRVSAKAVTGVALLKGIYLRYLKKKSPQTLALKICLI